MLNIFSRHLIILVVFMVWHRKAKGKREYSSKAVIMFVLCEAVGRGPLNPMFSLSISYVAVMSFPFFWPMQPRLQRCTSLVEGTHFPDILGRKGKILWSHEVQQTNHSWPLGWQRTSCGSLCVDDVKTRTAEGSGAGIMNHILFARAIMYRTEGCKFHPPLLGLVIVNIAAFPVVKHKGYRWRF